MKRLRIPIIARILGFNILLVFVPVASFLSLDTYEKSLLESLELSLVQQGRLLAAWLAEAPLTEERASAALGALGRKHTARLRVIGAEGRLLADSSSLAPSDAAPAPSKVSIYSSRNVSASTGAELDVKAGAGEAGVAETGGGSAGSEGASGELAAEANPVYRFFSGLVRLYRRFAAPSEALPSADFYARGHNFLEGAEVRSALEGRYGAATRISAGGQVSVTLYSALPIASDGAVRGVVLASQSTYRILASLYRLRLDVARIFLLSLVFSVALSFLLWLTISRPLRRLADRARSALSLPSLAEGHFSRGAVSDEIDDLAGTLREFSSRLGERLSWAEEFAADLAHEIRNPLASIRASAELIDGAGAEEARLLAERIREDCGRVNRIVGGLRELSRIEAEEGEGETADVLDCALNSAKRAQESIEARAKNVAIRVGEPSFPGPYRAALGPARLALALGSLLDNAVSFSPSGGEVEILLERAEVGDRPGFALSVLDRGPGLPQNDAHRVFERFFTTRSGQGGTRGEGQDSHCGLGLAIVQGIARRSGGRAEAADRAGGGARFTLYLRASNPSS